MNDLSDPFDTPENRKLGAELRDAVRSHEEYEAHMRKVEEKAFLEQQKRVHPRVPWGSRVRLRKKLVTFTGVCIPEGSQGIIAADGTCMDIFNYAKEWPVMFGISDPRIPIYLGVKIELLEILD